MDTQKIVVPALALIGGALLGRMLSLRMVMRGAMAALAVTNAARETGLLQSHARPVRRRPRRKATSRPALQRAARRKAIQKKSAPAT